MRINKYKRVIAIMGVFIFFITSSIFGTSNLKRDDFALKRSVSVFFRTGDSGANMKECKASNANGVTFQIGNNPLYLCFKGMGFNIKPAKTTHPMLSDYKFVGLNGDRNGVSEFNIKIDGVETVCVVQGSTTFIKKEIALKDGSYEIGVSVKKEANSWLLHLAGDNYSSNYKGKKDVDEAMAYLIGIEYIKKISKDMDSKNKDFQEDTLLFSDIEKSQNESAKKLEEVMVTFKLLEKATSYSDAEKVAKQIQNAYEEVKKAYKEARGKASKFNGNANSWKEITKIEDILKQMDAYSNKTQKLFEQLSIKFKSFKLKDEMNALLKKVESKSKEAELALSIKDRKSDFNKAKEVLDKVNEVNVQIQESLKIAKQIFSQNPDDMYVKKITNDINTLALHVEKLLAKVKLDFIRIEEETKRKDEQIVNEIRKDKTKVEEKLKDIKATFQSEKNDQEKIQLARNIYQELQEIEKNVISKANGISHNVTANELSKEVSKLIEEAKRSIEEFEEGIKKSQEAQKLAEEERIRELEILGEVKKQHEIIELKLKEAKETLKAVEGVRDLGVVRDALNKVKTLAKEAQKAADLAKTKAGEIAANVEAQQLSETAKNRAQEVQDCVTEAQGAVDNLQEAQKRAEEERKREARVLGEVKKQQELVELKLKEAKEGLKTLEGTKDLKVARNALNKVKTLAKEAQKAADLAKAKAGEIAGNVEAQQLSETAKNRAQEVQDCVTEAQGAVNNLQEAQKRAEEERKRVARILEEVKKQQELVELKLKEAKESLKAVEGVRDLGVVRGALNKVKTLAKEAQKAANMAKTKAGEIAGNVEAQQLAETAKNRAQEVQDCVTEAQSAVNNLQEAQKRAEEERKRETRVLGEVKKQQELVELKLKEAKEGLKAIEGAQDIEIARNTLNKVKTLAKEAQRAADLAKTKAGEIAGNVEGQQLAETAKNRVQEVQGCVTEAQGAVNNLQEAQKRAEEERKRETRILGEVKKQQELVELKLREAKEGLKTLEGTKDLKVARNALNKVKTLAEQAQRAADLAKTKAGEIAGNVEAQQLTETAKNRAQEVQGCVTEAQGIVNNLQEAQKRAEEERKKETRILGEVKKQQEHVELKLKEAKEGLKTIEGAQDIEIVRNALNKVKTLAKEAQKAADLAKTKAGEIAGNVEAQQLTETAKNRAQEVQDCVTEAQGAVNNLQEAQKRAEEERKRVARILGEVKKQQEHVELKLKEAKEGLKTIEGAQDIEIVRNALNKVKTLAKEAQKAADLAKTKAGEIAANVEAQQLAETAKNRAQEVQDCVTEAQGAVNNLQEAQKRAEEERKRVARILGEVKKQQELVELKLKEAKEGLKTIEGAQDIEIVRNALNKVKTLAEQAQRAANLAKTKAGEIAANVEAQQLAETAKNRAQEVQDCATKAQGAVNNLQAQKIAEAARIKEAKILGEIKKQQGIVESKLIVAREAQKKAASSLQLKKAQQAFNQARKLANESRKAVEIARRKSGEIGNNIEAKNAYISIENSLKEIQGCVHEIEKTISKIKEIEKKKAEKKKSDQAAKKAPKKGKAKNKQAKNKKR